MTSKKLRALTTEPSRIFQQAQQRFDRRLLLKSLQEPLTEPLDEGSCNETWYFDAWSLHLDNVPY